MNNQITLQSLGNLPVLTAGVQHRDRDCDPPVPTPEPNMMPLVFAVLCGLACRTLMRRLMA